MLVKLQDRIGKLLLSRQWSDCVFKINSTYIYAHRVILASASPVFDAMLYGSLAEVDVINIYDIDLEAFKCMLSYIYTDKSSIPSIENACKLLYASIKYMLHHLQGICKIYIMKNLSISNALEILDFAIVIHDDFLMKAAMQVICTHPKYVFLETDYHPHPLTMLEIAKQETINISEIDLLDIINKWYLNECDIQGINISMDSVQKILIDSEILHKIRFSSMSMSDYSKIHSIINHLPHETLHKMTNNAQLSKITLSPRKKVNIVWHYCICRYFKSSYPLWVDSSTSSLQVIIIANKTVLVNSFKITSRLSPPNLQWPFSNLSNDYNENIKVEVVDNYQNIMAETNICSKANFNDYLNINLNEPIVFRNKEPYTVRFKWNMEELSTMVAQYPQQFVSDIGSKNGITFSIKNQEATFICGITYSL